jgi:K+-transporting ATPase ATPase C chain
MKKMMITAILYTLITAVLLGVVYPLAVTGLAHMFFPRQAEGSLVSRNGVLVGSHLIGQAFSGPGYFWSRPSSAGSGNGYDAPVPIDLATASASGLDPDISPAAAFYQVARVAAERHVSEDTMRNLVSAHITQRQFGLLGEPRVNVLELNLALDKMTPAAAK